MSKKRGKVQRIVRRKREGPDRVPNFSLKPSEGGSGGRESRGRCHHRCREKKWERGDTASRQESFVPAFQVRGRALKSHGRNYQSEGGGGFSLEEGLATLSRGKAAQTWIREAERLLWWGKDSCLTQGKRLE